MNRNHSRLALRTKMESNQCIFPASIFDPVSIRIAEQLEFEAAILAGSVASLTVLGDPDHIVLTLSELAQQAYRICRSSPLPLFVDADHGFGNALNVRRTVEELETAGVSGLSIEDTNLPRPFGSTGKVSLISIEEGIGKMQAAVDARQDSSLILAARTSLSAASNMDETIKRIEAYQLTGVDAIFLIGVKTRVQLEIICQSIRLPLMLGTSGPEIMDRDYLSDMGVKILVQGHQPALAAIKAVYKTLSTLRQGHDGIDQTDLANPSLLSRLNRTESYNNWIQRFLEKQER